MNPYRNQEYQKLPIKAISTEIQRELEEEAHRKRWEKQYNDKLFYKAVGTTFLVCLLIVFVLVAMSIKPPGAEFCEWEKNREYYPKKWKRICGD